LETKLRFRFLVLVGSVALASTVSIAASLQIAARDSRSLSSEAKYLEVLRKIYREVKEIGPKPGENFISQEFFLGPDEDDSYKNDHIVVLIHQIEGREKMKIQVTKMRTVNLMPHVQAAGETKLLTCSISGQILTVERSDFSPDILDQLAPEILRAVLDKKKLLKLSDRVFSSS